MYVNEYVFYVFLWFGEGFICMSLGMNVTELVCIEFYLFKVFV